MSVNELDSELYSAIRTDGNVTLYENRFSLPVGFMLPSDMAAGWNYQAHDPASAQNSFAAAVGCGDILHAVSGGSSSTGEYTLSVPETGFYFLDVTNSSIKDVTFSNGSSTKDFSNVNRGFFLDLGRLEAGAYVTLTTKQDDQNFTAQAYRLDLENLQTLTDALNAQPLIVDHYTDTSVIGRVTASSDGLLYTSIPYEKGWTLKVDNVETEPTLFADTMLAVPLTAGVHSIELSYRPEGLRAGLLISAVSAVLLALLVFATRTLDRRPKSAAADFSPRAERPGEPQAETPAPASTASTSPPDTQPSPAEPPQVQASPERPTEADGKSETSAKNH